jgi:hypothetical protein
MKQNKNALAAAVLIPLTPPSLQLISHAQTTANKPHTLTHKNNNNNKAKGDLSSDDVC